MQEIEKLKYEEIWGRCEYRSVSPGLNSASDFLTFFQSAIQEGDSLIDFGCGTGQASSVFLFKGLDVHMVDIAANCLDEKIANLLLLCPQKLSFLQACLWDLPEELPQADWIYCCDVLEHLPEEYVDRALDQMRSRMRKGGFLQIFLKEEPFGELIGKELHLTLRSKEWWMDRIQERWKIASLGPEIEGYRFSVFIKE